MKRQLAVLILAFAVAIAFSGAVAANDCDHDDHGDHCDNDHGDHDDKDHGDHDEHDDEDHGHHHHCHC